MGALPFGGVDIMTDVPYYVLQAFELCDSVAMEEAERRPKQEAAEDSAEQVRLQIVKDARGG